MIRHLLGDTPKNIPRPLRHQYIPASIMKIKLTANIHLILHIHAVSYDTYYNKYRGEKFEDDGFKLERVRT